MQVSSVHGLSSSASTGVPGAQAPARHVSAPLQTLVSAQLVPLGAAGCVMSPEMGAQTSRVHGLPSSVFTGVPGVQEPVWHVSEPLHWSPSEQETPLGLAGSVQWPFEGSQMP